MRGSAIALAAAVLAGGAYVTLSPQDALSAEDALVPDSYLHEARRQVEVFMSWLRDEDSVPGEAL